MIPKIEEIKNMLLAHRGEWDAIAMRFAPGKPIDSTIRQFRRWVSSPRGMRYEAAVKLVQAIKKHQAIKSPTVSVTGKPITDLIQGAILGGNKITIIIRSAEWDKYYPDKAVVSGYAICAED